MTVFSSHNSFTRCQNKKKKQKQNDKHDANLFLLHFGLVNAKYSKFPTNTLRKKKPQTSQFKDIIYKVAQFAVLFIFFYIFKKKKKNNSKTNR
jgi:hypothetical protein